MPTRSDVAELRRAQERLSELAVDRIGDYWSDQDLSNPIRVRNGLLVFVPAVTATYGEAAAVVAADWYDGVRAAERVPGRFRAVMAPPVAAETVRRRVRYGARHLFTDTPGEILPYLNVATDEFVQRPARDTVQRSAIADPRASGWHRETRPTRSYAAGCGFCQMLAGRGGVYKRETAVFAAHGGCRCVASPSWDPDAPEVPAETYRASVRYEHLRERAAAGSQSAQRQLDDRRQAVRDYVADNHVVERRRDPLA